MASSWQIRAMFHETRTLLARLSALLGEADPCAALEQAFVALRQLHIERADGDATPDSDTWLTVQAQGTRLQLQCRQPAQLEPGLEALVGPLLAALLERIATQDVLRTTQERLQLLSSAAFEGLFIHIDGVVLDCNETCLELVGLTREEFLAPNTIARVVAPEDLPIVAQHLTTFSEDPYIVTALRSDGARFLAEIQAKQAHLGERPVRVVVVRDVTEREREAHLLREREARLSALAGAVFDFFLNSVDGRIVEVGGKHEAVLGFSREEMVGRMSYDFVAPSELEKVRRMVRSQVCVTYEVVGLHKSGELVPLEITGMVASHEGQPGRFAGIRDLREPRRIERERQALQARVERGQRMEALGVLAGGIAHDFNNLLLGVMGHAELLELTLGEDAAARPSLDAIQLASQRAAELTRQLLAYAGRGGTSRWEPFDLSVAVRELRGLLSPRLEQRGEVHLHLQDECTVRGDPTTLRQVLMNLLTNAADALPPTGGRIDVHVAHLSDPGVHWEDALGAQVGPGRWVLVEVHDTGVGMDARAQSHIFEPFYTTKAAGHGLGLAACLGILRTHGGAIRVQSEPGAGTRFSVLLPSCAPEAAAIEAGSSGGPVAVAPCSVLVVDDEAVVRDQLTRLLALRGFSVRGAADGEEGVRAYLERAPELVILDLAMPGMDGLEVARRLREHGSQVPILLSSGYLDARSAAELEGGLVQGVLLKPYSLTDLLRAIAAARGVKDAAAPALH